MIEDTECFFANKLLPVRRFMNRQPWAFHQSHAFTALVVQRRHAIFGQKSPTQGNICKKNMHYTIKYRGFPTFPSDIIANHKNRGYYGSATNCTMETIDNLFRRGVDDAIRMFCDSYDTCKFRSLQYGGSTRFMIIQIYPILSEFRIGLAHVSTLL